MTQNPTECYHPFAPTGEKMGTDENDILSVYITPDISRDPIPDMNGAPPCNVKSCALPGRRVAYAFSCGYAQVFVDGRYCRDPKSKCQDHNMDLFPNCIPIKKNYCHYHYKRDITNNLIDYYPVHVKPPLIRCELMDNCDYPATRKLILDGRTVNACENKHSKRNCYRATCKKWPTIRFYQSGLLLHSCEYHFGKLRIFG